MKNLYQATGVTASVERVEERTWIFIHVPHEWLGGVSLNVPLKLNMYEAGALLRELQVALNK